MTEAHLRRSTAQLKRNEVTGTFGRIVDNRDDLPLSVEWPDDIHEARSVFFEDGDPSLKV